MSLASADIRILYIVSRSWGVNPGHPSQLNYMSSSH